MPVTCTKAPHQLTVYMWYEEFRVVVVYMWGDTVCVFVRVVSVCLPSLLQRFAVASREGLANQVNRKNL